LKEELRALRSLQLIDNQMVEARRFQAQLDQQLRELKQCLDMLRQELLRQEVDLEETHQLKEEHEAALKAQEEAISRSKSRMAGVKKTQEYMAIQRELENARKSASSKEEELLKIIEVEEATRTALHERRARLQQLEEAVRSFEQSYRGKTAEMGDRVGQLEQQRSTLLQLLPKKLLRQYERILEARDGLAMAEVKDEMCLACHMGIPPQLYNELQRGDQIVSCPSCQRILFYGGGEAEQQERAAQHG